MSPFIRTFILMVGLAALLMFVGSFWGANGVMIGFGIALLANLWAWWRSAENSLKAMKARPVTEEELPQVYAIVRELSQKAGKPMPQIYVSPQQQPNAFATGRSPRHAAVCVTVGILEVLDGRQLRAVLGHELGHVYNWDILINSIAATFASSIMFLANMAQYGVIFGGRDSGDREANRATLLLIAILGPFAATVIRMAIGRGRELGADNSGGILTDDPLALADALETIEKGVRAHPMPTSAKGLSREHMMLASPFALVGFVRKLFSTHPPTELRVERMEELAAEIDPDGDGPEYQIDPAELAGLPLKPAHAQALGGAAPRAATPGGGAAKPPGRGGTGGSAGRKAPKSR